MKNFSYKNVLVMGDGISAEGATYALEKLGASVTKFVDRNGTNLPHKAYDLIVISPGIAKTHYIFDYAKTHGIPVIGEIELGYMINDMPVIAVTGTNGKTTTVCMIERLLSKKYKTVVCGNIGISFSRVAVNGGYDLAIVEVSSFQLESIKHFKPEVAVITNIAEDHLDRHGSMEEYSSAKKRIAENQDEGDVIVLSQDDLPLKYLTDFCPKSKVIFVCSRGKINGAYCDEGAIYYYGEKIMDVKALSFYGRHNISDFLNAVVVAKRFGVSNDEISDLIKGFKLDNHRIQLIRELNGIRFYDDSKGTNVAATICAIDSLKGTVCLIAGGSEKNCGYDMLFRRCIESDVKVKLIGESRERMKECAYKNGFCDFECFDSLSEAVESAYKCGCDNVLLSPATASFDMFSNYEERGKCFAKIVNALV